MAAVPGSASALAHQSKHARKHKKSKPKPTTVLVKCASATPVICQGTRPGPQGAPGANGANGANATALWAVVDGTSPTVTVVRGTATSAVRTSAGNYNVTFSRDVSSCAYEATLGIVDSVGFEAPGTITVGTAAGNSHAVYVRTTDLSAARLDHNFHLAVFC